MRFRRLIAVAVAAAVLGRAPAPVADSRIDVAAAHSCGRGYTHAVLPTGHKCLRRGQYCALRFAAAYRRTGSPARATPRGCGASCCRRSSR